MENGLEGVEGRLLNNPDDGELDGTATGETETGRRIWVYLEGSKLNKTC